MLTTIVFRNALLNRISVPPEEVDIKKIKACIRSDFHIHNLRTVRFSFDSFLTISTEIGFLCTQSSGTLWMVVYPP